MPRVVRRISAPILHSESLSARFSTRRLLFFGDSETMMLSQFAFRLHKRFTCVYSFLDAWLLDIRFESEHALDPKRQYPRCVAGARRAPLEDSGGAEIFMDRKITETPGARKRQHGLPLPGQSPALLGLLHKAQAKSSSHATEPRFAMKLLQAGKCLRRRSSVS
jgi:Plasmid pRiA4b ORF-3-like protein